MVPALQQGIGEFALHAEGFLDFETHHPEVSAFWFGGQGEIHQIKDLVAGCTLRSGIGGPGHGCGRVAEFLDVGVDTANRCAGLALHPAPGVARILWRRSGWGRLAAGSHEFVAVGTAGCGKERWARVGFEVSQPQAGGRVDRRRRGGDSADRDLRWRQG